MGLEGFLSRHPQSSGAKDSNLGAGLNNRWKSLLWQSEEERFHVIAVT